MLTLVAAAGRFVVVLLRSRSALVLENLALRQQLAVLRRSTPRPRIRPADRIFWVLLSRAWSGWQAALHLVEPATVLRWHRAGFRLFWRWKSGRPPGRPPIDAAVRKLIAEMAKANPTCGAPRIHGELLKLGFTVAESTVTRYMRRAPRRPSSPTWRTFIESHLGQSVGVDFFAIPTATFRLLYGFVIIDHLRRRLLHLDVTDHRPPPGPRSESSRRSPVLFRDRDSIFGNVVRERVKSIGIEEVIGAQSSPWQNPYAERVIGTIRRELLDHVIILNERHARTMLHAFRDYYNGTRTHLSLAKRCTRAPPAQRPIDGDRIVPVSVVGGLHH